VYSGQAKTALDTIILPEVKLVESRLGTNNIGNNINIINIESLDEGSSVDLANIISSSSSVYVKQYGALATPTFRGSSSSHTLVLWNGMPINSIANGLADLSGIFCNSFSDIVIVNGGEGSLFGSGAIGGSIHLNSLIDEDESNKLLISSSNGSYGFSSQSLQFNLKNGKLVANGGFNYLKHENDFEYFNSTQFGNPLTVNENGKLKSNSQNLNLLYNLNKNTNFKFSSWFSDLEREVPQNMTVFNSDAKQYDAFKRLLFSLKHERNLISIDLKHAYLKEDFRYTEELKNIDSYYIAESYISDVDIKLNKRSFLINIGSGFTNNNITNNNFSSSSKQESSLAYFSAIQYKARYFKMNSILRKEWHSTFKVPLIPTFAFESKVSRNLKFRIKYNRNFRNPTYNDRFWSSGGAIGNINLVPENSWNREFGFDIKIKNFFIRVTAYKMNIFDMIIWQQMDNSIWMPNNIKEVYSRGLESKLSLRFWKLGFESNYSFTKSTHEIATSNLDISVGQQLRYVPLHKGGVAINFIEQDFRFSLRTSYTGEVITSYALPNNKTLDAFVLTDFSIKYKTDFMPLAFQIKVKNLTNESYVTYLNYPNPGREYLFTIEYSIN
tara:strand:- start:38397 stop:40229 length:1833 start_codon:yes stop_codon:yes gene_type:complete